MDGRKKLVRTYALLNKYMGEEIKLMELANTKFNELVFNNDVDAYGKEIDDAFNAMQSQYNFLKPIMEHMISNADHAKLSISSHEEMLKEINESPTNENK